MLATVSEARAVLWPCDRERARQHVRALKDLCREQLTQPMPRAVFLGAVAKTHLYYGRPDLADGATRKVVAA
jgi:hypothetical protein